MKVPLFCPNDKRIVGNKPQDQETKVILNGPSIYAKYYIFPWQGQWKWGPTMEWNHGIIDSFQNSLNNHTINQFLTFPQACSILILIDPMKMCLFDAWLIFTKSHLCLSFFFIIYLFSLTSGCGLGLLNEMIHWMIKNLISKL